MNFPPPMLPINSLLRLAPYSNITWLFGPTDWVCWTYSLGSGNYPGIGSSQETYTSKWISIWSLHTEFTWFIPYYTKLDVPARLRSQMLHSIEGLTLNFGFIANIYSSRGFLSCCDIFCYFCSPLESIGKVEQDNNCSIISNCRTRRMFLLESQTIFNRFFKESFKLFKWFKMI